MNSEELKRLEQALWKFKLEKQSKILEKRKRSANDYNSINNWRNTKTKNIKNKQLWQQQNLKQST